MYIRGEAHNQTLSGLCTFVHVYYLIKLLLNLNIYSIASNVYFTHNCIFSFVYIVKGITTYIDICPMGIKKFPSDLQHLAKFQKYSFKTDCHFKGEGGTRIELQLAAALLCKQVFYK